MVTPNPRPVFTGPWRLIDLGNRVQWFRPIAGPLNDGTPHTSYMGQWMLIGPIAHDRFPKRGVR